MLVKFEGEEYTLDLMDLEVAQAKVIKSHCGLTYLKLMEGLAEFDPDAVRAVYWLMHAQSGKPCNIDNINFGLNKFMDAMNAAAQAESEAAGTDVSEEAEAPKE